MRLCGNAQDFALAFDVDVRGLADPGDIGARAMRAPIAQRGPEAGIFRAKAPQPDTFDANREVTQSIAAIMTYAQAAPLTQGRPLACDLVQDGLVFYNFCNITGSVF